MLQSSLGNIVKTFRFNRKVDFPAYEYLCVLFENEYLFYECLRVKS
jgi:hypothetical protein